MQSSNSNDDCTGPGDPLEYQFPWLSQLVVRKAGSHKAHHVGAYIAIKMDAERRTWTGKLDVIAAAINMPLATVERCVEQLTDAGCLFTCQSGDEIECALNFNFDEWAA